MDTIFIYIALAALTLAILIWRLKGHVTTYGSACWLMLWEASAERCFRARGLLLGDWSGTLRVFGGQDGHALTVAPTGRGKGTCAIIPNLLRQRFAFVVDPGGENTAIAIKSWRAKGFDVQVLNPWGMHSAAPWELPAHSFNPLAILDPKSMSFTSDASLLAEMLISRGANDGGNTAYFKDEAKSGIRAMLMHMVTTVRKDECNLVTLRDWIMRGGDEWTDLMNSMIRNKAARGAISREATQLLRRQEQAPEEFSAIVSTMKQDTNFLEDPVMQEALSANDADFSALKGMKNGKPITGAMLSVIIPLEYLRSHAAYARLAIAVALWQMQRAPIARERVLFVLDEFPALGRMDRIASGLAELRKYKVWLWPIVQDLSQLKSLYDKSWATFLSNASVKQWFGTGDLETARYVSASCGESTVFAKSGFGLNAARRVLVTPDEVQTLPMNRQIVMTGNLRPMQIRLTPYWDRPEFAGQFHPNPFAGKAPSLPVSTPLRMVWGNVVRLTAWVLEPAPALLYTAALAAVLTADPGVLEKQEWDRHAQRITCVYRGISGVHRKTHHWPYALAARCPEIKIMGSYWL